MTLTAAATAAVQNMWEWISRKSRFWDTVIKIIFHLL
jgi:hypothetical protein